MLVLVASHIVHVIPDISDVAVGKLRSKSLLLLNVEEFHEE